MRRIFFVLAIVLASAGFSFASDTQFRAPRVDFPNGGEVFTVGVPVNIKWLSPGAGEAILKISLSTDAGKSYKEVLAEFSVIDKAPSYESWLWDSPRRTGTDMKVKVAYITHMPVIIEDESDRTFTVKPADVEPAPGVTVTTPNGGEKFVCGNPILIQWRVQGIIAEIIEIRLSTDGGSSYPYLLAKLDRGPKMLGWYWENEKFVGKGMRISVTAYTKAGTFTDTSDKSFVITPGKTYRPYPKVFSNFSNYPNPFNPTTCIEFDLIESGSVTLTVYDVLGQEVVTLVNDYLEAGSHAVEFDATGLPSGSYVYRLDSAGETMTQMMQLMK